MKRVPEISMLLCLMILAVIGTAFAHESNETNPKVKVVNGTCVAIAEEIGGSELLGRISLALICVALSALFAGLTLGVLGLDTLSLEVMATSGLEPDRTYAQIVLPLRRSGHHLLCTLLIGNVMMNVLISLLTDALITGIWGFIISTTVIVLLCEIIPQSVCTKYALYIGSRSVLIVNFFQVLLYPFAKPIAVFLDYVVGHDPGQIYDRNMLRKLIAMHAQKHSRESGLTHYDFNLIAGAIDFDQKRIRDVMTTLDHVFMLEISTKLTDDVLSLVWEKGHSRVPVYKEHRSCIVGVLFVKDLIFLDVAEKHSIESLLKFSPSSRKLHFTFEDTPLKTILKDFTSGRSHLALVQKEDASQPDSSYPVIGIVTLEDVIEELIRTDIREDAETAGQFNRMSIARFRYRGEAQSNLPLDEPQLHAVAGFLLESVEELQHMEEQVMVAMLRKSTVCSVKTGTTLYQRLEPMECLTLILNGRVEIKVGMEGVRAELPSWSVLGVKTLVSEKPLSDYSAVACTPLRVLRVLPTQYAEAMAAMRRVSAASKMGVPPPQSHQGAKEEGGEAEHKNLLSHK